MLGETLQVQVCPVLEQSPDLLLHRLILFQKGDQRSAPPLDPGNLQADISFKVLVVQNLVKGMGNVADLLPQVSLSERQV